MCGGSHWFDQTCISMVAQFLLNKFEPNLGKDASILLVDDDDDLRNLLRTVLTFHGYSVTEACNCSTATGLLKGQNFDAVLLDITLPDGNGLRVAEFIQEHRLPSKVIVMTGTNSLANAVRGAALGVKDYITKPFSQHYLLRCIKNVLATEYST